MRHMVFSWAKREASGFLFWTTDRPEPKYHSKHHKDDSTHLRKFTARSKLIKEIELIKQKEIQNYQ